MKFTATPNQNLHATRRLNLLRVVFIVLALAVLLTSTGVAEEPPPKNPAIELPSYYPKQFHKVGVLRNLSTSTKTLYMNASKFKLKPEVRVYLLNSPMASLAQLKPKMVIGIQYDDAKKVTGIWVLPVEMHHPS